MAPAAMTEYVLIGVNFFIVLLTKCPRISEQAVEVQHKFPMTAHFVWRFSNQMHGEIAT